jgi:hypothetical protein
MSSIYVEIQGDFNRARVAGTGRDIPVRTEGGYATFTLPALDTYDVVILMQ